MRRRVVAAIGLAALTAATAWILSREPSYQGVSLSDWIDTYYDACSPGGDLSTSNKAAEALCHFGSNAVPFLTELAATPDSSPFKKKVVAYVMRKSSSHRFLGMQRMFERWARQFFFNPTKACLAFQLLGPEASSAVPALVDVVLRSDNPHARRMAVTSLRGIGPKAKAALPALLESFKKPSRQMPRNLDLLLSSMSAIDSIGFDINVCWRPESGPIVLPKLLELLKDPDADTVWVVRYLGYGGLDTQRTLPLLLKYSKHEDEMIRLAAQAGLKRLRQAEDGSLE